MILKKGNVFKANADYFGITTNSTLNYKGDLVMGAGIALDAKKRYPKLPRIFGEVIRRMEVVGSFYGILFHENLFAFQTKRNWRTDSLISDVKVSVLLLKQYATVHPEKIFALPFPAINNGGLRREDILPLLVDLPDNVHIYELVKN